MNLAEFQRLEQTKALYRHMPIALGGVFAVSLLTLVLLWNNFDHKTLISWFCGALVLLSFRAHSLYRYSKANIDSENTQKWLTEVVIWSLLSGTNWGLVTLLFIHPEEQIHTLFLTCVFAGYISGSTPALAMYFPAFLAFILPPSIMFVGQSAYLGGELYFSLAVSIIVYLVIIISFGRRTQADFLQTARLTFENEALIREVTEQKETAENAVLAKNQFLAAASHDLRQPLHALGLFINSLEALKLGEKADVILVKLDQSTAAINGLLHSLLDISRLDANVVEYCPSNIDLGSLTEKIVREYEPVSEAKGIQLVATVDPEIAVFTDAILFERVLRNIVDNAIKFTNEGLVSIDATRLENKVKIEIKDSGQGIPTDDQENVFSEFTQLNNPERDRAKGLGLGLAIVKRLCNLMDIELSLSSFEKRGTTFSLIVCLGQRTSLEKIKSRQEISLTERVIAVIDDELDILEGMRTILQGEGANVVIATDAEQAITLLDKQDLIPEIILADFRLRNNANGINAIARIRDEFNSDIHAMLITGDTSPDRLLLAQTSQLPVLHKPVRPTELLQKIHELIVVGS